MGETTETSDGRKRPKMIEIIGEENFLVCMLPEGCLDGQTENMTGNIGKGWSKTRTNRKEYGQ